MPRSQKIMLAAIFSPSTSDRIEPTASLPSLVSQSYFNGSSERRIITEELGISERQTPRLLVKVHLPSEPSEKLTVNGIMASFTMVGQSATENFAAVVSFSLGRLLGEVKC
jgi:hypothetical protein